MRTLRMVFVIGRAEMLFRVALKSPLAARGAEIICYALIVGLSGGFRGFYHHTTYRVLDHRRGIHSPYSFGTMRLSRHTTIACASRERVHYRILT